MLRRPLSVHTRRSVPVPGLLGVAQPFVLADLRSPAGYLGMASQSSEMAGPRIPEVVRMSGIEKLMVRPSIPDITPPQWRSERARTAKRVVGGLGMRDCSGCVDQPSSQEWATCAVAVKFSSGTKLNIDSEEICRGALGYRWWNSRIFRLAFATLLAGTHSFSDAA